MSKNALVLFPYQLFSIDRLPRDVDQVVLVEDPLLFGKDQQYPMYLHKQKLVFLRASMMRYAQEVLWPAGYEVEYIEFHQMSETGDIVNKLVNFEKVEYFELNDDVLSRRLAAAIKGLEHKPEVNILKSPNFYLSESGI